MAKMKKEQQQVAILVVVLLIIVGVLVYFYKDKLLPKASGEAAVVAPRARMSIPKAKADDLYARPDFTSLKRFGDVPVKALPGPGSSDPFVSETPN